MPRLLRAILQYSRARRLRRRLLAADQDPSVPGNYPHESVPPSDANFGIGIHMPGLQLPIKMASA
jgi:hypothetical protein